MNEKVLFSGAFDASPGCVRKIRVYFAGKLVYESDVPREPAMLKVTAEFPFYGDGSAYGEEKASDPCK